MIVESVFGGSRTTDLGGRAHGVAGVPGPPKVSVALLRFPSGRRLIEASWGEFYGEAPRPLFGVAELAPDWREHEDAFEAAIAGAVGCVVAQLELRRVA